MHPLLLVATESPPCMFPTYYENASLYLDPQAPLNHTAANVPCRFSQKSSFRTLTTSSEKNSSNGGAGDAVGGSVSVKSSFDGSGDSNETRGGLFNPSSNSYEAFSGNNKNRKNRSVSSAEETACAQVMFFNGVYAMWVTF